MCKVCVKDLQPTLSQICATIKCSVLDDSAPMTHVKGVGQDGLIVTHVAQDIAGIANQYTLSVGRRFPILIAQVLQCIAEHLIVGYCLHVLDFLQGRDQTSQDPGFLIACANEDDMDTFYEKNVLEEQTHSEDKYGYFILDFDFDTQEYLIKHADLLKKESENLSHLLH